MKLLRNVVFISRNPKGTVYREYSSILQTLPFDADPDQAIRQDAGCEAMSYDKEHTVGEGR